MDRLTPSAIFDATVDLLEHFCALSSASGDPEGLHRASAFYGTALAERGMDVRYEAMLGAGGVELPVVDATWQRAADRDGAGGLLVIGHVDTVLPAITPRRHDGRLTATGAIDMKGGLAALLGALDLLAAEGRRAPGDLRVVIVPDEEVTGPVSKTVVQRLAPTARALWVLEPGQPRCGSDAPSALPTETLVVGRRGLLTWSLDVEGRGAHAGNGYWQGRSALFAAADWALRARGLNRAGNGPTVNAGRLVAGDRDFVEGLRDQADLLFSHRQTNVVPDRGRVEGEARYLLAADGDRLRRSLPSLAEAVAADHEVETRFDLHEDIPALEPTDAGRALAEEAAAHADARGWRLEIETDRRGISFPNFLLDPSVVPTLDGLGPVGAGMHTRDETIELDSLDRRIVLLADLLAAS